MPRAGAITLADIAARIAVLEVRCDKCGRAGRYRVAGLIAKHGAEMGLPTLRGILAADCPRMQAGAYHDRCGVRFPNTAPPSRTTP